MTIYDFPALVRFFMMTISIICCVLMAIVLVWQIQSKYKWYYIASSAFNVALSFWLAHMIRACVIAVWDGRELTGVYHWFYEQPAVLILLVMVFIVYSVVVGLYFNRKWQQTHIITYSIIESINRLPVGVCYYYDDGLVRMVNHSMSDISVQLTGKLIDDGQQFWSNITRGFVDRKVKTVSLGNEPIFILTDGRVISFSKNNIEADNENLVEILASDITEEYLITQKLSEEKERVSEINQRLRDYSKRVVDVTIEREILEAKIKIHDELGHVLIMTKKVLSEGSSGSSEDRRNVIDLWKKNNRLLKEVNGDKENQLYSAYESLLYVAKCSGIDVRRVGELPENQLAMDILTDALSEFVTNTFRHGNGNKIRISIRQKEDYLKMLFINNGILPKEEVGERGGLLNLRRKVEENNGIMKILIKRAFMLQIELPNEGET